MPTDVVGRFYEMVVEMIESQENGFVDLEADLVQTSINVSESVLSKW